MYVHTREEKYVMLMHVGAKVFSSKRFYERNCFSVNLYKQITVAI